MIFSDSTLFGWADNLFDNPLPTPFISIDQKSKKITTTSVVDGASIEVPAKLIRPLIKAMVYYAKDLNAVAEGKAPSYIAMGTDSSTNGQEITYVELKDPDYASDMIVGVEFDPANKSIKGFRYDTASRNAEKYAIKAVKQKNGVDGTAVWVALLPTLAMISEKLDRAFTMLRQQLSEGMTAGSAQSLCDSYFYDMCYEVYEYVVKTDKLPLELTDDLLPLITAYALEAKTVGPSYGKVELGTFSVFPVKNGNAAYAPIGNYDISSYHLSFVKETLTKEEQLLIPTIPEDNVTPREAVELLDEMSATWENPPATKVTQVLLEGGAGSGKSYTARLIAAVLKRPFVSFTCSPNTDEADIKGALLPVASDEQLSELSEEDNALLKVIYDSSEDDLYDQMAHVMALPDTMECLYAPDSAYEQMTGISDDSCDSQKAYAALCSIIMVKVKELMSKVKSVTSGGGVSYKYIPSTIVRAIQNGWLLELQEPSCMLQQGMLACLFDVMDKESIGALNTTTGTIYRHPDFMCIATTNRKYKGTKPLNEAARSRFQYFCKMETPSEEVIVQRVAKKVGITDFDLIRGITDIFKKLEERAEEINASGAVTLRGLYAFADAIKRDRDVNFALEHYLLYSITTDDEELADLREALEDCALIRA